MLLADLFRVLIGLFLTVAVVLILHTVAVLPFLNADVSGANLTQTRSGLHTAGVSAQEVLMDTRHNPFTAAHVIMLPAVDAEILQTRMEVGGVNVGGPGGGGQDAIHLMGIRNIRIMEDLAFRPGATFDPDFTLSYIQTLASMNNRQLTLTPWAGENLGHPLLQHGLSDIRLNIMVHGYGSRSTVHFFTGPKPERLVIGLHTPQN